MARFSTTGGSGNGSALNYVQVAGTQQTISSAPNAIVDLDITTTGAPVQISVTGEGANASAGSWLRLNLFRDNVEIGNAIQMESSAASENVPFAINFIDDVAAGTYNYSARVTTINGGNWTFGEAAGPIINAVELTGFKGDTGDTGPAGEDGSGAIADFIFTDNGGNSTITLPGAKRMDIISGDEEDLYITSGDDLYLTALLDDVFIRANDDVRFISNYQNGGTEYNWTMNSNGDLDLPGGITNDSGTELSVIAFGSAVVLNGNNGEFLNDATVANNQIATIGDINDAVPTETSFTVNGGTLGTAPTFDGAPLFSGSYVKHGPMVHFQIQVDMDNITSFGTGQYYVDLPFPAKYGYQVREGCLHDISADRQYAIGGHVAAGQSRLNLFFTDTSGQDQEFDHNSPVTLAVADNFHVSGTYISE